MLTPFPSDTFPDLWGLEGEHGGISYEPDFSERQARMLALAHNELGAETYEEAEAMFPSLADTTEGR